MKKLILILGLGIAMSSCTNMVIVESVKDGKTMRLRDAYDISKKGDTLVVQHTGLGQHIYGKYNGVIPTKNTISLGKGSVNYELVKRIR